MVHAVYYCVLRSAGLDRDIRRRRQTPLRTWWTRLWRTTTGPWPWPSSVLGTQATTTVTGRLATRILTATISSFQSEEDHTRRLVSLGTAARRQYRQRRFASVSDYTGWRKKRGQWSTLSHCKYSENSMTELRRNCLTSAILYAEHSH